jgi:hypothetical protein
VKIELTLEESGIKTPLTFEFKRMINAGYTGRNQAEVRAHIDELAQKGIPGPAVTPTMYPVIARTLVTDNEIEVYSNETSGEAEYVLLIDGDGTIYVGVGSDHTDRHLEETDIPRAKQICPNVISSVVWRLDEVSAHWDELELASTITVEGKVIAYQKGTLGALMSPAELMEFIEANVEGDLKNTVIFSGTLANLLGEFGFGERFDTELVDPKLGRKLTAGYAALPLDYAKED